jgi:hypothetical protein
MMMRVLGFPIALPAAILCAGAVMIAWPFAGSSLHAAEAAQGTMFAAQGTETATKPVAKAPGESQTGQTENFTKDAKKALRDIDKQIAALGKKMKKQGTEVKAEVKESWNDLKEKQHVAKLKLKELSKSGGDAWQKTKSDFNGALDDLKKSYDKAVSSFK